MLIIPFTFNFFYYIIYSGYRELFQILSTIKSMGRGKREWNPSRNRDYYENYDRHAGRATAKDLVRESLRFGIRFTF